MLNFRHCLSVKKLNTVSGGPFEQARAKRSTRIRVVTRDVTRARRRRSRNPSHCSRGPRPPYAPRAVHGSGQTAELARRRNQQCTTDRNRAYVLSRRVSVLFAFIILLVIFFSHILISYYLLATAYAHIRFSVLLRAPPCAFSFYSSVLAPIVELIRFVLAWL